MLDCFILADLDISLPIVSHSIAAVRCDGAADASCNTGLLTVDNKLITLTSVIYWSFELCHAESVKLIHFTVSPVAWETMNVGTDRREYSKSEETDTLHIMTLSLAGPGLNQRIGAREYPCITLFPLL